MKWEEVEGSVHVAVRVADPPSYVDISSTSPTQVSLRISRPVNSGGYPVTGYVVEYEPAQSRRSSNRQVLDTGKRSSTPTPGKSVGQ